MSKEVDRMFHKLVFSYTPSDQKRKLIAENYIKVQKLNYQDTVGYFKALNELKSLNPYLLMNKEMKRLNINLNQYKYLFKTRFIAHKDSLSAITCDNQFDKKTKYLNRTTLNNNPKPCKNVDANENEIEVFVENENGTKNNSNSKRKNKNNNNENQKKNENKTENQNHNQNKYKYKDHNKKKENNNKITKENENENKNESKNEYDNEKEKDNKMEVNITNPSRKIFSKSPDKQIHAFNFRFKFFQNKNSIGQIFEKKSVLPCFKKLNEKKILAMNNREEFENKDLNSTFTNQISDLENCLANSIRRAGTSLGRKRKIFPQIKPKNCISIFLPNAANEKNDHYSINR